MFLCPSLPPLKLWILSRGLTKTGQKCLEIPLLGNFPVSQVAYCRYTLLAWNSPISLAGSEEHINFSQQSPNRSDYTQRESNKGKGTKVKQSPPLPFSQGNALGTRLKQGPPLWVFCEGKNLFPHWCLSEKHVFTFGYNVSFPNEKCQRSGFLIWSWILVKKRLIKNV